MHHNEQKLKLVRVSSKRKRLSILIVVGRASQCSEYIGGLHGWLHLTLAHPLSSFSINNAGQSSTRHQPG
jgi:hypothetical protein